MNEDRPFVAIAKRFTNCESNPRTCIFGTCIKPLKGFENEF